LAAALAGADAVEVDVRLTADGTPVLHHDITLQRIWGLPWPVHALSADRLRGKVPQVPTLREALDVMLPYGVPLVLDLRSRAAARAALDVVRQARPRRATASRLMHASNPRGPQVDPRVWFCGTPHSLLALRRADPALTLMLTWRGPMPPCPSLLRALAPALFNPWHVLLSEDLVDRWHRRGIGVSTWTVDDPDRLASLHRAGVDAIITNDLLAALSERGDHGSPDSGGHRAADYLAS
jgi:glycerophosphoryl diester phosphodiesterase